MSRARRLDPARLPRLRAAAQLLHRPAAITDPVDVARGIAGAQAQDRHAGPLSFRSRSRRLRATDVDRARAEDRSLLRTWVMRKTIHLIPAEDAGWMLPLFEPAIERWSRRRIEQLGMTPAATDKALRAIERALRREGPLTRSELGERVGAAGVELNPQTRLHAMLLAVTSGLACLGPDRGRTTCLILREEWLGKPPRFDRDAAMAELARRYLLAFGPAGERDFAHWSGLGLREVRQGLNRIAKQLVESRVEGEALLSLGGSRRRFPRGGSIRLLGAFDTYMLGYRNRDFALPQHGVAALKEGGGGWIRPVIVEDGRGIGTWRGIRKGGRIKIAIEPFGSLRAEVRAAIEREAEDIGRFEGLTAALEWA